MNPLTTSCASKALLPISVSVQDPYDIGMPHKNKKNKKIPNMVDIPAPVENEKSPAESCRWSTNYKGYHYEYDHRYFHYYKEDKEEMEFDACSEITFEGDENDLSTSWHKANTTNEEHFRCPRRRNQHEKLRWNTTRGDTIPSPPNRRRSMSRMIQEDLAVPTTDEEPESKNCCVTNTDPLSLVLPKLESHSTHSSTEPERHTVVAQLA